MVVHRRRLSTDMEWYMPIFSFFPKCRSIAARIAALSLTNVVAAALLDRLLHHAIVIEIEGHSYRLREHANLVPDTLKGHPAQTTEKPKRKPGWPRQRSAAQSD